MNKKAFVLMETIVVIVVVSIALLTIFKSYNKILTKVKSENKYDTSEYIYMTKYVKEYLKGESCVDEIFDMETGSNTPKDYYSNCSFDPDKNNFNIKKIHVITNINKYSTENLKKFDAYMIDYIKKLDVNSMDSIIIVEYKKVAKNDKGKDVYTTACSEPTAGCEPLKETYIASLGWE